MKKLAFLGVLLIILGLILGKNEKANIPINELFSPPKIKVVLGEKNAYYRNYDFSFVQNTEDFNPDCKQDLLNIYYTVINAGKNSFTFYCSKEYENCLDDVKDIANDKTTLSLINNYVHPYNGFNHIETEFDNTGKVEIIIHKSYSEDEIITIEQKLDEIQNTVLTENTTQEQKIKLIHDYIIKNTKYDVQKTENTNSTLYKSEIAYGPLLQGYGICSGYTDAMQLILERLEIENFKVATTNHVWNAVKIDDTWKHLDLTWDDPILDIGLDWIIHDFYLISTEELLKLDQTEHTFDQNIYVELKQITQN